MAETYPTGVVFAEIPVADIERAKTFYEALLEAPMTINTTAGPYPKAVLSFPEGAGVSGHIVQGKPAQRGEGTIVHIAIPDTLEAAMERVRQGGGEVTTEVITIPVGAFFYAFDSEGNTLGIFKF